MSDVTVSSQLFSYQLNASIDGYTDALFTTVSGSPSVVSGVYRLNTAATRLNFQCLHGGATWFVNVAVAPTAGHARRIGYISGLPDDRGSVYFDITGAAFTGKVVTNDGTVRSIDIVWNTDWTAAETPFTLSWDEKMALFSVGEGANKTTRILNLQPGDLADTPVYPYASNSVADNMDISSVVFKNIKRETSSLVENVAVTSVVPGTGATNLGKAEDTAHVSGDTGVFVLARRADTASSSAGTDGDYAALNTDSTGHLHSAEGFAAQAENNADKVIHTAFRAISSNTGVVSTDISAALEASSVTKAAAGRLYGMRGYVDSTAASDTYYILFMNATSLPSDGAVSLLVSGVPIVHTTGTDTPFTIDFTPIGGIYASTGIVSCLSTTALTKTIAGSYLNTVTFYA